MDVSGTVQAPFKIYEIKSAEDDFLFLTKNLRS